MHAPSPAIRAALLALGVAALAPAAAGAQPYQAAFSYVSEPGDPVGLGQSMSLSQVTASHFFGDVSVAGTGSDGGYALSLRAPDGQTLGVGVYENARAGSASDPALPYLEFRHDERRCEAAGGRFEITDIATDPSGYVERLSVNFEQRCAGSTATLWGQVDIVKPEVVALTRFEPIVEKFVDLYRSGPDAGAIGYVRALCNTEAGGTYGARLEQRTREGTVVGSTSMRFTCGPTAPRVRLDFGGADAFRPGLALLTFDAFVIDPKRGEQGAGYVQRTVTSRVVIRPRNERHARP